MKRTTEQWINCNPKAMAEEMSKAAQQFAFEDAKSDIMELSHENKLMREVLRKIAYPRRGTEEDTANIQTAAMWIQDKWTLHTLDA
jgi:hypothetical protein